MYAIKIIITDFGIINITSFMYIININVITFMLFNVKYYSIETKLFILIYYFLLKHSDQLIFLNIIRKMNVFNLNKII